MHHKGSHYSKPRVVTPAEAQELKRQTELGNFLCNQIDVWREKQGLPPFTKAHLRTNSKRSKLQQFINEEIVKGLAHVPAKISKMIADALKAHKATAVANIDSVVANRDFSFGAGPAGPDFARDAARRRLKSQAYCKAHPVRRSNASDDPAIKAMHAHSDMVAFVQSKGK